MQEYELIAVLKPTLSQEDVDEVLQRIKETISQQEGEITGEEPWGMKRLAQVIRQGGQKYLEGNYHLLRFTLNSDQLNTLQNVLRLSENILRFLVVKYVAVPPPTPVEPAKVTPPATTVAQENGEAVPVPPKEDKQEEASSTPVPQDKEKDVPLAVDAAPITTKSQDKQEN